MAIWQFDLAFAPANWIPSFTPDGMFEGFLFDAGAVLPVQERLREALGEPGGWAEDFLVYGEDQGNRIDVLLEPDGAAEIQARIDARVVSHEFLRLVQEVACLLGSDLYSLQFQRVIPPSLEALQEALAESRAAAYARGPRAFLSAMEP